MRDAAIVTDWRRYTNDIYRVLFISLAEVIRSETENDNGSRVVGVWDQDWLDPSSASSDHHTKERRVW